MGHSSSLIGDPSLVESTSGVSQRSLSLAMSILHRYVGGPTHRYGLSVFRPQRPWLLINRCNDMVIITQQYNKKDVDLLHLQVEMNLGVELCWTLEA